MHFVALGLGDLAGFEPNFLKFGAAGLQPQLSSAGQLMSRCETLLEKQPHMMEKVKTQSVTQTTSSLNWGKIRQDESQLVRRMNKAIQLSNFVFSVAFPG